ncbi:MAG TPA: YoaK family protein, partial [Flavobacteriales bacterium]
LSNSIIINLERTLRHWARAIPMLVEIICLCGVGYYGHYHYRETLMETEILVAVLLFSMGLQNGLTASISNFAVKTTHLTGLTTDLAIHLSMATRGEWRNKPEVRNKILLLSCIAASYLVGGVFAGSITGAFQYRVFFFIASVLLMTLVYDAVQQPSSAQASSSANSTARSNAGDQQRSSPNTRRKLEPSYNA